MGQLDTALGERLTAARKEYNRLAGRRDQFADQVSGLSAKLADAQKAIDEDRMQAARDERHKENPKLDEIVSSINTRIKDATRDLDYASKALAEQDGAVKVLVAQIDAGKKSRLDSAVVPVFRDLFARLAAIAIEYDQKVVKPCQQAGMWLDPSDLLTAHGNVYDFQELSCTREEMELLNACVRVQEHRMQCGAEAPELRRRFGRDARTAERSAA